MPRVRSHRGLAIGLLAATLCAPAVLAQGAPTASPAAVPAESTPRPVPATAWPRLTKDDFRTCLPEIRYLRRMSDEFLATIARESCARPDGNQPYRACDAEGRNCEERVPCRDAQRALAEDKAAGDLDWFWKGNARCEGGSFPCFGPWDDMRKVPDDADGRAEIAADLTEYGARSYDLQRMPPVPRGLASTDQFPADVLSGAAEPANTCMFRVWSRKLELALAQSGTGRPAAGPAAGPAGGPAARSPAAAPAPVAPSSTPAGDGRIAGGSGPMRGDEARATVPMSEFQCRQAILQIHRDARDLIAAARSPAAADAANAQMARRQRALFEGPCSEYPEAADYIATAEGILAKSAALAARPAAPGSEAAPDRGGRVIATSGEPAHQCLQLLEAGLYGGFANKCKFRVNYTYCVSNPKKGTWTDAESFRCESASNTQEDDGYLSVGPLRQDANHTRGGERVHWFACKDPAVPYRHRFDGSTIRGLCMVR